MGRDDLLSALYTGGEAWSEGKNTGMEEKRKMGKQESRQEKAMQNIFEPLLCTKYFHLFA